MLPDVARELLGWNLWEPGAPVAVAYAPGRLDVLGGIADYSGATVLEMPLALGALVAAQATTDGAVVVRTGGPAAPTLANPALSLPCAALSTQDDGPERLADLLAERDASWAAYMLGPLALLRAAGYVGALAGLRLAVWSDLPAGAGVSSSAALEIATLRALAALFALEIEPLALARVAQAAEQRVARAPCGIMDQVTSLLGQRDALLALRCQPAEILGQHALPRAARVFGIDSGVAHRVSGDQYARVRAATFMGRAIIVAQGTGDPPGGYLCNLRPDAFLARCAPLLPEELSGAAFLDRYGPTGDAATMVERDAIYRVRACATHPVLEQTQGEAFLAGLDAYARTGDIAALDAAGAAMYASHTSYGERCGLGTPETDLIVELVRAAGPVQGLHGARITGGGAGGTVAVLASGPDAGPRVAHIAAEYAARSGHLARVFAHSGEGALRVPVRWRSPGASR